MAYNPYGKAKKGETAAQRKARQKKFYSFQREYAEDTGDKSTVQKIYKKLGRKAPATDDPGKVDKQILGNVALDAIGGPLLAGAARIGRGVAGEAGSLLARRGGSAAESRGARALAGKGSALTRRAAPRARVVGKAKVERAALPGKRALPSGGRSATISKTPAKAAPVKVAATKGTVQTTPRTPPKKSKGTKT